MSKSPLYASLNTTFRQTHVFAHTHTYVFVTFGFLSVKQTAYVLRKRVHQTPANARFPLLMCLHWTHVYCIRRMCVFFISAYVLQQMLAQLSCHYCEGFSPQTLQNNTRKGFFIYVVVPSLVFGGSLHTFGCYTVFVYVLVL